MLPWEGISSIQAGPTNFPVTCENVMTGETAVLFLREAEQSPLYWGIVRDRFEMVNPTEVLVWGPISGADLSRAHAHGWKCAYLKNTGHPKGSDYVLFSWVGSSTSGPKHCNHEWTKYIGFTEVYDYCKKCDVKEHQCQPGA